MALRNDWTECYAVPGDGHIIDGIDPDSGLTLVNRSSEADILQREPRAVRMLIADFLAAKAARQQSAIVWHPSTEAQYHEMLGVLPPIDWARGAFLVGEASDHCASTGRPRYQAYRRIGDEYFVASRPMTRAELSAIIGGSGVAR